MHKKWMSEKFGAKFPAITRGYSMVKFAHLDDAFFEVFWRQASPLEGQSLQQKEKKGGKRKSKKKNNNNSNVKKSYSNYMGTSDI